MSPEYLPFRLSWCFFSRVMWGLCGVSKVVRKGKSGPTLVAQTKEATELALCMHLGSHHRLLSSACGFIACYQRPARCRRPAPWHQSFR